MRKTAHLIKPLKKTSALPKRESFDITFFVLLMVIVTIGLITLFTSSYANAYYRLGDSFYYIKRQVVFAVAGIAAMLVISKIDYHILHRLAVPIYVFSVLLMLMPRFLPAQKGVYRWIDLGLFTFQPSEMGKFAVILLFAHLISIHYKKMKTFKYGFAPFIIFLAIACAMTVLEKHLSGTILILIIGLVLMFVGGTSLKWFGFGGIAMASVLVYIVAFTDAISYAMSRITMWLDPFQDPSDKGLQTIQSLYAIGSGGLLGLGLGNSRQKYLYVPEPQNDFVFSIICEEMGFVGASIIILLFALLVWRGFVIALRSPDKFGALLAIGLTFQVGLQAALNIAVVTNTIPNTGISLPFFSAGGSSLVMLLCQMGVILSISRSSNIEKL